MNPNRGNKITLRKLLTDQELKLFRAAIPAGDTLKERREALILWILVNTGIRASEVCALRVCDTPGVLGANAIEVYKGKRKSERDIPVSDEFAADIENYVQTVRPATMPKRFAKSSREGWLFWDRYGRKLTRQQIYRLVVRTGRRAGIRKKVTPHMLRHTFASRAIKKDGSNIYAVKEWLGHNSLETTQKYLQGAFLMGRQYGEMLDQKNH